MKAPGASRIVQFGYVVPSLSAAVAAWTANLGAGPFFGAKRFELRRPRPGGEDLHCVVNFAAGQCGAVQIELIEPIADNAGFYGDGRPAMPVLHHGAIFVADLDEAVARYAARGCPCLYQSDVDGVAAAFIDTRGELGFYTELYQAGRGVERTFERIGDAATGWDGSAAIRSFAELAG